MIIFLSSEYSIRKIIKIYIFFFGKREILWNYKPNTLMGVTDHSITHAHTINARQDKQLGLGCERSRLSLVCQRLPPGAGAVPTVAYQHSHLEMKQTTGNKTTLAVWHVSSLQTQNLKILS